MRYVIISILLVLDGVAFYFLLRNFLSIKKTAEENYPLYLIEKYNLGLVTKHQIDTKDMSLFKNYYKQTTRNERLFKLAMLGGLLGIAISLIFSYFANF